MAQAQPAAFDIGLNIDLGPSLEQFRTRPDYEEEANAMPTDLTVYAFVMADRIIEEKDGRYGAIGLFSAITLKDVDDRTGPPWNLYVEMSGFHEHTEYNIKITVGKPGEQATFATEGTMRTESISRHAGGAFAFPIPPATYSSPGLYEVSLLVDGKKIISRFLEVIIK